MIRPHGVSDGLETAVVYLSMLEQLYDLWEEDDVDEGVIAETATAMIEIACLGRTTSDDKAIVRELRPYIRLSAKSRQKYIEKCETTAETEIQKLKLEEIADLMDDGKSGTAIAEELDLKKSTVYNRMKKIKEEYPFLLKNSEFQSDSNGNSKIPTFPKEVRMELETLEDGIAAKNSQNDEKPASTSKNAKKAWSDDDKGEEFDF